MCATLYNKGTQEIVQTLYKYIESLFDLGLGGSNGIRFYFTAN